MTEQQQLTYKLGTLLVALFEALSEGANSQEASWLYANYFFETEEAMDELL